LLGKKQALAKMEADIQLRGLSANTQEVYLRYANAFLDFCQRPIEELNEIHIRAFLQHLISEKKCSPGTVNINSSAIRFFFAVTLNRTLNYLQIPRMKKSKTLPVILSREEVNTLISHCNNTKHKALLLLAYGSGLRVSEIISLKVNDIDSKNMRVFVYEGKGKKDRYTLLSESTIYTLRDYWRKYRPKSPEGWLFPGSKNVGHITCTNVSFALDTALNKASIDKSVSIHTLRHCFATHLLEDGYSLLQIKELLGHYSIQSTTIYLHLANTTRGIISPADHINLGGPNVN